MHLLPLFKIAALFVIAGAQTTVNTQRLDASYNVTDQLPRCVKIPRYNTGPDIFQGDIRLPGHNRTKRGAPIVEPFAIRWGSPPVYYNIDASISAFKARLIREAIADLDRYTCIRFEEGNPGPGKDQLKYVSESGCSSALGKQGGEQKISIGDGCAFTGVVLHETFHALGIAHTQSRHDRDSYITIIKENIESGAESGFDKYISTLNNNFGLPYDFGSIMHYETNSFSKNPALSTIALKPQYERYKYALGNSRYMTFNDLKLLNSLYQCNIMLCPFGPLACANGGFTTKPNFCQECVCSDFCCVKEQGPLAEKDGCVCSDFWTGKLCKAPVNEIVLTKAENVTLEFSDPHGSEPRRDWGDWFRMSKAPVRNIRAANGLKVGYNVEWSGSPGGPLCVYGCIYGGLEIVEREDLTVGGKMYCCWESPPVPIQLTGKNRVGYKAYAPVGSGFYSRVVFFAY